jgi:glycosyltransferase involved in cell wall biosynthesis
MVQLKNYLSRIGHHNMNKVALISSTNEFEELIPYLADAMNVQTIYFVSDLKNKCNYSEAVKICNIQYVYSMVDDIDAVIFDKGIDLDIGKLAKTKIEYLIGRMAENEDYFKTWEAFRNTASHIYIESDRQQSENGYEVVEWDRPKDNVDLSVVLPVYNVSQYLPKCIESLTEWKADYVEFLFVDDGSTDNSSQIIKEYAQYDSRIKLVQKQNGGCASARNRGIEESKGRYIGFVDPDDFVDSTMFPKLLERAMLGNYELAYCGYQEYYEDTGETCAAEYDCIGKPYVEGTYRSDKIQLLSVNTRVAIWRCLYLKSVLIENKIRFHEDLKRFDDLPFRIEYIFVAKSAVCVPEYLYYYRIGRKGQDISCNDEGLYVHFDIFNHLDNYVERFKDQRMWDLLQAVKLHTHMYALSKIDKKYRDDYIRCAKSQLRKHAGYFRNIVLILMYAGKRDIIWLTKLWLYR